MQTPVVGRICPLCGEEPQGDAGPICAVCGGKLIEVREARDELIGQVIDDRFEVRALLGRGGMGSVYRALQRSVGREIAIKLIDAQASSDPMAVRRFLREARLASQLSHPSTVTVLDFGQAKDGRLFLAMELVPGRTLADLIDTDAPLSVARSARICAQICEALEAAHALGILHRDLKPGNVMIQAGDRVKILDFGLAKSLREEESKATAVGIVVGTPGYLAPELLSGADPTVTSDLYAIGVILAEMVTGRLVFGSQPTREIHALQQHGMPAGMQPPESVRPLLERLLSPAPSERPQTAAALRAELELLVSAQHAATPARGLEPLPSRQATVAARIRTERVPRRGPRRWLLPAAGGLSLAALGSVALLRLRAPASPSAAELAPVEIAALRAVQRPRPAPVEEPAAATDGKVLIHVVTTPPGATITVDGAQVGTSPADVSVQKGKRTKFVLALGGHVDGHWLNCDGDEELNVQFPAQ